MIEPDVNLSPYNTFNISVRAKQFARFSSIEELQFILQQTTLPPLLLGGGSNILFSQKTIPFIVLKNEIKGFKIEKQEKNHVYVCVGAGENWHSFVLQCLQLNFGGLENLSLIPGNVGASPMQNIGAYGTEIKEVFHSLRAYNIHKQQIETFYNEDCQFGYRESIFKHELKGQYIILNVTYRLTNSDHVINTKYRALQEELDAQQIVQPTIHDVSSAVIAVRQRKLPDPNILGNAGSFFKNPIISRELFQTIQHNYEHIPHFSLNEHEVKIPAGWLIEQTGWKGKKIGNCGVHDKQALVLVNYSNAKGREIVNLSQQIIKTVNQKFGVLLQTEVNII